MGSVPYISSFSFVLGMSHIRRMQLNWSISADLGPASTATDIFKLQNIVVNCRFNGFGCQPTEAVLLDMPNALSSNLKCSTQYLSREIDISPGHFLLDVFPRTFSPAFLHTRTFLLCMTWSSSPSLTSSTECKCCTAALPTWRRPTSYRRC